MRVVIAEDAALLREGLTRLLEDRGHSVCAAVTDGDALLDAVAEHRPDVAVVDIRMPPTHTDEGLRAALATCSRTGWPTWPSSPRRWSGSRAAGPRWTPRWSASCSGPAGSAAGWPRSPRGSARCSR